MRRFCHKHVFGIVLTTRVIWHFRINVIIFDRGSNGEFRIYNERFAIRIKRPTVCRGECLLNNVYRNRRLVPLLSGSWMRAGWLNNSRGTLVDQKPLISVLADPVFPDPSPDSGLCQSSVPFSQTASSNTILPPSTVSGVISIIPTYVHKTYHVRCAL